MHSIHTVCPAGLTADGWIADTLLDHLVHRTIVLADKAYDARSHLQARPGPRSHTQHPAQERGAGNLASVGASTASP